jgi:20S proteasome subunit beta 6
MSFAQIGFKNQQGVEKKSLSKEKAVHLIKDIFISAAERDIYTGDALLLKVVTKDGVEEETFPLRRD